MRIAIFSNNDRIWNLPLWKNTFEKLGKNHEIISFYQFPDIIDSGKSGFSLIFWYMNLLGPRDFLKAGLFGAARFLSFVIQTGITNFRKMSEIYNAAHHVFPSTSAPEIPPLLEKEKIELILALTTHEIPESVRNIPEYGIISKHCGLLPEASGAMPYVHSVIRGISPGMTFIKQTGDKPWSGIPLLRLRYTQSRLSFTGFTRLCFGKYAEYLPEAVKIAEKKKKLTKKSVRTSEFLYPSKDEISLFRKKGFQIVKLRDFLKLLK